MVLRAPPCAGTDPALKKSRRDFFSASRAPPPPSLALLRHPCFPDTKKTERSFFSAPSVMLFLQLTRPARWILCRFWRATP